MMLSPESVISAINKATQPFIMDGDVVVGKNWTS
jgi:hypothetical protein